MTSSTGKNRRGFTFVEIMVTLIVLSSGIIMIYKSFFLCMDYLSYLTCRLYATQMIENKISQVTRSYRESQDNAFERGAMTETLEVNHKWVDFKYDIQMSPVGMLEYTYRLKVALSWNDGKRMMSISRESVLAKL